MTAARRDALLAPAVGLLATAVLLTAVGVAATTGSSSDVVTGRPSAAAPAAGVPAARTDTGGTAATSGTDARPPAPEAAALLAGLDAAVRRARTVRFTAVTTRTPDGGPAEVEGRLTGVLDVVADAGRADVDLPALAALADAEPDAGTAEGLRSLSRAELRWTAQDLTIVAGADEGTVDRGSGTGGLLERLPEEPLAVLRTAAAVRPVNADAPVDVEGTPTTLVEGEAALDALAAPGGDAGPGAATPLVPVEVWVDATGLPLRVRVTSTLPALGGVPERRVTTTYDFRGWGAPVAL